MLLGILLILKTYNKITWTATMSVMVVFTIFLIYSALFRDDENCHCFGNTIELSPIGSIIKNIIIIILLFLIKKDSFNTKETNNKKKKVITILLCPTVLLLIFIISPIDSIYKMIYSTEKEVSSIDLLESFDDVTKIIFNNDSISFDTTSTFSHEEGMHMIAIVSSGCKYCHIGVKKLSMIMRNKEINSNKVNIFIWGSPEGITDFAKETLSENYTYWHIMPNKAIDITYGRFPTFIWLDDKKIVKIGDFRDIDDKFKL